MLLRAIRRFLVSRKGLFHASRSFSGTRKGLLRAIRIFGIRRGLLRAVPQDLEGVAQRVLC